MSTRRIPPKEMKYVQFNGRTKDKFPETPEEGRPDSKSPALSFYDVCELHERLCRAIDLPNLKHWDGPGVARAGAYFANVVTSSRRGNDALVASELSSAATFRDVRSLCSLFLKAFENVPFLDGDAECSIFKKGAGAFPMKDSYSAGGYGTTSVNNVPEEPLSKTEVRLHVYEGGDMFACLSDGTLDRELKTVRIADTGKYTVPDPDKPGKTVEKKRETYDLRVPAHWMHYCPTGHRSPYYEPGEAADPARDGFARVGSEETTGTGFQEGRWNHGMRQALCNLYPRIECRFKGSDPTSPWDGGGQGSDAFDKAETSVVAALALAGTARYDGNTLAFRNGSFAMKDETSEGENGETVTTSVPDPDGEGSGDVVPRSPYRWNWWDSNEEPKDWGDAPGVGELKKAFLPPYPDGVLPMPRCSDRYPPSKEERDAAISAPGMGELKTQETSGRFPNVSGCGTEFANDPMENAWLSPAAYLLTVNSLFKWADRMRYTVFPLDESDMEYSVVAKASLRYQEKQTGRYKAKDSSGYKMEAENDIAKTKWMVGDMTWRGTGFAGFGVGRKSLPGLNVSGPFSASLPTTAASGTATCRKSESSYDYLSEVNGGIAKGTGSGKIETTVAHDVSAKTSGFRPLMRGIGAEEGRLSYRTGGRFRDGNYKRNNSDDAPDGVNMSVTPGGTAPEPLLTPKMLACMESCRLYALVRVSVSASGSAVEGGSGEGGYTYNASVSGGEWSETKGGDRLETSYGVSAQCVGYRLLDLGEADSDGTFREGSFEPYKLVKSVLDGTTDSATGPGDAAIKLSDLVGWTPDPESVDLTAYWRASYVKNLEEGFSATLVGEGVDAHWEPVGSFTGTESYAEVNGKGFSADVDLVRAFLAIKWDFSAESETDGGALASELKGRTRGVKRSLDMYIALMAETIEELDALASQIDGEHEDDEANRAEEWKGEFEALKTEAEGLKSEAESRRSNFETEYRTITGHGPDDSWDSSDPGEYGGEIGDKYEELNELEDPGDEDKEAYDRILGEIAELEGRADTVRTRYEAAGLIAANAEAIAADVDEYLDGGSGGGSGGDSVDDMFERPPPDRG